MFGPRSLSDPRTDSWRIQFVSDPLTRCPTLSSRGYILPCLHLLGIQSCCIAPRPRVQLMTTTLRSQSQRVFWSSATRRHTIQIAESTFSTFRKGSFETTGITQQTRVIQGAMFISMFSKAGLVARQHVRVTNVTKQTPVAWFYVDTMTEKVKT